MTKIFPNPETKAAAYAAYKELERLLKLDGDLTPGSNYNVGNQTVEITIPQGTTVSRDKGIKGDGIIEKTATQNLYGWAILHECLNVAKLFKQHKKLERILIKIVRRAITRQISSQDAFNQLHPDKVNQIEQLKQSVKLPKRPEQTPRIINRPNAVALPLINVFRRKAA